MRFGPDGNFETYPAFPAPPADDDIAALTEALLAAKRPVIVCGGGVVLAYGTTELAALAEALDIAVVTSVSGQGSLAETHPNCAGVVGSNGGTAATRALVDEADCVLFIGCRAGIGDDGTLAKSDTTGVDLAHRRRPDGDRRQLPGRCGGRRRRPPGTCRDHPLGRRHEFDRQGWRGPGCAGEKQKNGKPLSIYRLAIKDR